MAEHEGPSSGAVLLGFLSGAALGAVMAILLAPRPGQESREMLRGYARRAEDGLRDLVGEAGEKFEGVVEEGRDFIESKKNRAPGCIRCRAGGDVARARAVH